MSDLSTKSTDRIALVDLDGTLCDYMQSLREHMERIRSPEEPEIDYNDHEPWPDYLKARKRMISSIPGFWSSLTPIESGMQVYEMLEQRGFEIHVLTNGPMHSPNAWSEKVLWCQRHIPGAQITITRDKGTVYGRVLVDDYPEYITRWLAHRDRGVVIMPDRPWNRGTLDDHPAVFRYDGSSESRQKARQIINNAWSRKPGEWPQEINS